MAQGHLEAHESARECSESPFWIDEAYFSEVAFFDELEVGDVIPSRP